MGEAVRRAFKYRFYPTPDQAEQLSRTFGCVRVVYNKSLEERTRFYKTERRAMSFAETSAALTRWKKTDEYPFLNEVSSVPLQQAVRHLQTAFDSFFAKRSGYPRFKTRRRSRASAEFTRSAFTWRDGQLTLAKMRRPLRIAWSRPLPPGSDPSTVTVSRDAAGRWFVSLRVEDRSVRPLPATDRVVGVDVGLSALVTLSTGEKVANPRHAVPERRRLRKAQRSLCRKERGSANREKARLHVAKIHARIADRRRDELHKLTTRLVRENQTVVIEDLSVKNMLQNHSLARAISDAGWSELRSMLEYKAQWYGRSVIVVSRWFPSSKRCSSCGHYAERMPLNIRSWTCRCGATHDRDVNAAKNILAAGLAERQNACGGPVRPEPRTRGRRGPMKQEARRAIAGSASE
ncbi:MULTISPECIES: RNA-guided endonuclease TnpB family protein [Micromonospora]|uniref:Transposase n=1 Tax=Micromonospora sicca TaxID=2202420 RepID=A0A317DC53_9ACTN|nr:MULTISPECIES: RNA-guided endonuclease TnpB family protein [unclassified Micromonospora]MBM0229130.1 transposase [Micromonospora sp. ATA51]PWR11680.1 transposase [Micromonospora sp. 4G51]